MTTDIETPAVEPAERAGLWEDFIDIFYAPSAVFERRAEGRWGWPLLVVTVFSIILFVGVQSVLSPVVQAEVSRALAQGPTMTQEQIAQAQRLSSTFALIGMAFSLPIGIVVVGWALWLLGKLVGAGATAGAAVMVAAYAHVPRVVEQAVYIVQGLLLDVSQMGGMREVTLSLARFGDPETTSAVTLALLGRVDLFVLWVTLLLGIGLSVVGRVSRGRGMAVAAGVWVLGTLLVLLGAMAQPG